MSFLTDNETPQQNSGPMWDPTGQLADVHDLEDSQIGRSSYYKEVFLPTWKSLTDAAANLLLEWFSGTLSTVGKLFNWHQMRQAEKVQHFSQWHAPKHHVVPEPLPIPLEEPIGLRKITGETRKAGNLKTGHSADHAENFSGSLMWEQAERKATASIRPLPKSNPWLEASRKQQCVLDIKPPQERKPSRKATKPGKKKVEDEPNRGLDDIYTRPVRGFFSEEKDFSFKKPASFEKKAAIPDLSTRTIAELIEAELDQALLPRRKTTESVSLKRREPQVNAAPPRELHDYELIPGLSPSPTQWAEIQAEAEANQYINEHAKPDSGVPASTAPPFTTHGASVMLAKARAASLEFKRKMPVYLEMKDEMTGAEHMAGNNRILHNSISNLADTYFKRAAEEEEPEYY